MSYRSSEDQVRDARSWTRFAEANQSHAGAAGLPALAFESQGHFEDLLMHGYFDHHPDPSGFTIAQLSRVQYLELVSIVECFFLAGYPWFMPMALREVDHQGLQSKFEKRA